MENQLAMTSNEILKADVLDIVFDNRNKNYGAYVLRKYYSNRLVIALGGMLGFVLMLILIVSLNPSVRKAISDIADPEKGPVVILEPPTPETPQVVQPPKSNVRTEKFLNRYELVPEDVPTDVPDQTDLDRSVISTEDKEGTDFTGIQQPFQLSNNTSTPNPITAEPPPAITQAAEFPGGQQAWMAFLNRHLRTPDELEAGQKRTVLVRFSVSTDGTITQFEIIQSGGAALDNEVIRVLKKMPKWKPAVQNGNNVSVMFTQPVTFMAFEE
jgi:protein TonB